MTPPNRHTALARLGGTPRRRYYAGRDLDRVKAIEDLRARTHRLMPGFVLENLEGGAKDEATLEPDGLLLRRCAHGKLLHTLEVELVHQRRWPTREEARQDLFADIKGYHDRRRIHSALGYRTPEQAKRHMA